MTQRLLTAFAGATMMLTIASPIPCLAASNTVTTLLAVDGDNQLETHAFVNCHSSSSSCEFIVGADLRTPDTVTGFPPDLWARQTTEFRSSNRLAYLDVHVTDPPWNRVQKAGGQDVSTTIYLGEGPPDRYQTVGTIDSTDWQTGQPRTDETVIVCTHVQVVYAGVNLTSPSTCAQTSFS
ncbi:MAG: hypothetical protein K2Q25_11945 [Mycobacteriaceae bacterium]|nr:hypothetical protein [Mycobacteriaceae bacterium]